MYARIGTFRSASYNRFIFSTDKISYAAPTTLQAVEQELLKSHTIAINKQTASLEQCIYRSALHHISLKRVVMVFY